MTTDALPTTLLYGQALIYLRELNSAVVSGALKNQNDFTIRMREILTRFERTAGKPLLVYEPFDDTEPPLSSKMNRVWSMASHDVSLLQNQLDILRAATIDVYNNTTSALTLAVNENMQIANQLKTLQLYSNSVDPTIVTFSDDFGSSDFIDDSSISPEEQASISTGALTLGQDGPLNNLSPNAVVKILETSNGIPGNNQEINLVATLKSKVAKNAGKTDPHYIMYSESNRVALIDAVHDGDPQTWYEYEIYKVNDKERQKTYNMNYKYTRHNESGTITDFDWANGPAKRKEKVAPKTLKLDLQFDLQTPQFVNSITYTSHNLRDNNNFPVLIRLVEISEDGAEWEAVNPTNVWVTNNPNVKAARISPNVVAVGVWNFEQRVVRYIRIHLEQPNPIASPICHLWYSRRVDDASKTKKKERVRVVGPKPTYDNPSLVLGPNNAATATLIQHRERFNGKRWAIGIRDINIQQLQYQTTSMMVTNPLKIGGIVDRISLSAEVTVPPSWPTDQTWVEFFVSPDDGLNWFQISRIQDDFLGIPEIHAFNDPIPPQFREPGVAYYDVPGSVDTLRLRIVLSAPPGENNSTPIVSSYQLKVKKRV